MLALNMEPSSKRPGSTIKRLTPKSETCREMSFCTPVAMLTSKIIAVLPTVIPKALSVARCHCSRKLRKAELKLDGNDATKS